MLFSQTGMVGLLRRFFNLILVSLMIFCSAITNGTDDPDIKTINANITNGLLEGTLAPSATSDIKDANGIIAKIVYDDDGNCYFSDIDYENEIRSSWPAAIHLSRTERLAILYRNSNDEAQKDEYKTYILKLLDHWIDRDYQNSNWWYNKLSNPNVLGEIGILMKDDLSSTQFRNLSERVGRGSLSIDSRLNQHEAANRMDIAMSTIKYGVLVGDRLTIKKAVDGIKEALAYNYDYEGIKTDGTFFQHGRRNYMGGYGPVYVSAVSKIHKLLKNTNYNFSAEELTPLAAYICDGMKYFSFGNVLDHGVIGRSVSRQNSQSLAGFANTISSLLSIEEMPRKDEIAAYAALINNNIKSNYGLKYFDVSKIIVINNSDFYFSFRGGSEELYYSEIVNSENILGYNSSFPGTTTIMTTGREYINLSPVCDFSLVPGTTAVHETDDELVKHDDFSARTLKGTYGSATAEGVAVSSAQTKHEDISMTVSCFATDNAAILLGAGLKDDKNRPMNTTLDQSFYVGSHTQDGNTVIHNSIKYTVLEGGELTARNEHRVGNWRRNNLTYASTPVEGDVFTISLSNTGSYAYTVMNENTNAEFEVIVNNESIQAVKLPDGRVAAAFYQNDSFDFGGNTFSGKKGEAKIFG